MGFAYTRKFDDESAIASLEKAVELDPVERRVPGPADAAEDVPAEAVTPYNQPMRRWLLLSAALVVVVVGGVAAADAQRFFREPDYPTDLTYDGRFTFVRLRWDSGRGFGRRGGNSDAWNHDYPRAEQHLTRLLKDITFIDARTDGSLILTLDDPRALQVSDRVHVGAGLLGADR